jgi:iron-sulfur cluster assembly protein
MPAVTDRAAAAIRTLAERQIPPTRPELRIAVDRQGELRARLAESPRAGDSIVDGDGVRVYLDATAAQVIQDRIIDTQTDADGDIVLSIED